MTDVQGAATVLARDLLRVKKGETVIVYGDPAADASVVRATVDAVERELILQTLATTSNKTRAAELLGISLKTLHNKLKEYEAAKTDGG